MTHDNRFNLITLEQPLNPQSCELQDLKFHPLEFVSRYGDSQHQMNENDLHY